MPPATHNSRLKPRFYVKIGAEGFLGVNAFCEVEPNESVHERRTNSRSTQRPTGMREVISGTRPAEIAEHDLAKSNRPRADLQTGHPERIPDRRTGSLTAHGLHTAEEELLLEREMTARCAATQRQRSVETPNPCDSVVWSRPRE